jgi:hypothetical protein
MLELDLFFLTLAALISMHIMSVKYLLSFFELPYKDFFKAHAYNN